MKVIDRWIEWREERKRKAVADYMAILEGLTLDIQEGRATVDAVLGGPPVKLFAVSMVAWFKETGGKNYVTCDLHCTKTRDHYQITMQKAGGTTPAQRINELQREIDALTAEVDTYKPAWELQQLRAGNFS